MWRDEFYRFQAMPKCPNGIVKLSAIFATIARRWISSSLQLTRDVVPDPMGVGSSLTVGSGCEEMAARAEDGLDLIMDG